MQYVNGKPFRKANYADYIDFNTNFTIANLEGRMKWNIDDGTPEIGMPGGNVIQQMGQEILIRAKNVEGSEIGNGKVVYVYGASGSKPTMKLSNNTTCTQALTTIAVATESITNNQQGYVCAFGYVRDINTNETGWTEGDLLYLDTNGNMTNTQPALTNFCISIGTLLRKHDTEGVIFVNIQIHLNKFGDCEGGNYTELNEGSVMYGTHTRWDDFLVRPIATRQGALAKPDFDYTDLCFMFPQNDPTEILYMNFQLPHTWKQGSNVCFHLHILQESSSHAVFKIDYRWFNIGTPPPAWTTGVSVSTYKLGYTSGTLHQIIENDSDLDGTGKTISSELQIRLYRNDNVVSGDVKVIDVDLHGQINSQGSQEEYSKT